MELTALALRSAAQKLRPYFQAHPVVVLTDQPLRNILHKPDLTGRMLQWAIELSEFGIEFQPRLSMKGQVMADFVLEYSRRPIQHKEPSEEEWWTLRVDGASRSSGSGVGLLLQSPTGEHLEQAIRLGFPASNNEAEYEVILSGLDLALALSVSKLRVYSDSQLVALCPRIPSRHTKSGCKPPFHPDWGYLYKRSFTEFLFGTNIRNSYSTPHYPQSNEQAEATNKTLITALKKRLEKAKGKWVEELAGVLWAYRTTPRCPTGNTPFALAYGMEAIIPTEIGLPTIRTEAGMQDDANEELGRNLDWADEVRETASIRMADYQQRASTHYNRKARPRSFKNGTLVLRKVFENTTEIGAGKFQANWEGPI
ncbi:hypothetical protein CK203_062583 [Vitis vinifera]|uniref:Integrase catalytic domain-containing protein n=1 Tax=Vitis vinifera TaxID=29760 RepID=A0A438FQF3_VITVI|nr:hypothetical protein CK203_062583 [Vitis vinifera]